MITSFIILYYTGQKLGSTGEYHFQPSPALTRNELDH